MWDSSRFGWCEGYPSGNSRREPDGSAACSHTVLCHWSNVRTQPAGRDGRATWHRDPHCARTLGSSMMSPDKDVTDWRSSGIAILVPIVVMLSTVTTGLMCASAQPSSSGLTETSWQLVKFQGPDGTAVTPDDRAKYTIAFDAGQLRTRVDCNRGR